MLDDGCWMMDDDDGCWMMIYSVCFFSKRSETIVNNRSHLSKLSSSETLTFENGGEGHEGDEGDESEEGEGGEKCR